MRKAIIKSILVMTHLFARFAEEPLCPVEQEATTETTALTVSPANTWILNRVTAKRIAEVSWNRLQFG